MTWGLTKRFLHQTCVVLHIRSACFWVHRYDTSLSSACSRGSTTFRDQNNCVCALVQRKLQHHMGIHNILKGCFKKWLYSRKEVANGDCYHTAGTNDSYFCVDNPFSQKQGKNSERNFQKVISKSCHSKYSSAVLCRISHTNSSCVWCLNLRLFQQHCGIEWGSLEEHLSVWELPKIN